MFRTPDGRQVPAVTAAEMREVDRIATEEVGYPLLSMMENAGRALAGQARAMADGAVTVLAGGGGNGGGGLAAARHLKNAGVTTRVVLDRDPADLAGASATQWAVLAAMGTTVRTDAAAAVGAADLVVDAVVGYGLTDALRGRAADLVSACAGERVCSLDVPSGVDATTGERPGVAVDPERTLTLALPKTGLADVGEVVLADLAIPAVVYERAGIGYESPFDGEHVVALTRDGR